MSGCCARKLYGPAGRRRRDQAVKTSNLYLNTAPPPTRTLPLNSGAPQTAAAQQEAAEKAQEQAEKERLAAEKQADKELEKEQERERRALVRGVRSVASTTAGTLGRQLGGILGSQFGSFGKKLGGNVGGQHRPQPAGHAVQALSAAAVHLLHEKMTKGVRFCGRPFAFGSVARNRLFFPFGRRLRLYCRGNMAANRENAIPAVHRRGGFHIRPVCGGAGVWREGHAPPLHGIRARPGPNGIAAATRANVGRMPSSPPGPRGAATPAGGINPAPTTNGRSAAKREPRV